MCVCVCARAFCSTSGIIPVRWTAPEGLTSQKFSSASDVWSFGVVCIEILQDGITPYPDIRSNPEVMTLVNNGEIHTRPVGCTDQVYDQLVRCFSFEPAARPLFADLNEFFAGLVPHGANAQGGISSTKPTDWQNQHYLSLLHEHTAGDPSVFNALREDGDIMVDDTYSTSEYLQLGVKRKASIDKENSIIGGLDGLQISTKLGQATEELHRHASKYDDQFEQWRASNSLVELKTVVSIAKSKFKTQDYEGHEQPNPWNKQGIKVTSKRYLTRVITVYNGTGAKYDVVIDPVGDVVKACGSIVARFGTGVKLVPGPPKKEQRIMEKARDGNYAVVRDLGRLSIIVEDISLVPGVIAALSGCPDFEVIRIKNRLDPNHAATDSAGYRDVQILVRELRGGWIVEVQVIPKEMYVLKQSCGHTGYAKYRFILEACKRARLQQAMSSFGAGLQKNALAANDAQAEYVTVVRTVSAGEPNEAPCSQPVANQAPETQPVTNEAPYVHPSGLPGPDRLRRDSTDIKLYGSVFEDVPPTPYLAMGNRTPASLATTPTSAVPTGETNGTPYGQPVVNEAPYVQPVANEVAYVQPVKNTAHPNLLGAVPPLDQPVTAASAKKVKPSRNAVHPE